MFRLISKISKISKANFIKYFVVGILATIVSTFLLWIFVEVLGIMAVYISPVVSAFIFVFKFYMYRKTRMFDKQKASLLKYSIVWIIILSINTFFLWIFVDILKYSVIIVNPILVVGIFLFRYMLFDLFKMLT